MRCVEFLFGSRSIPAYKILYVIFAVIGATVELEAIWQVADTLNGLMAIPNLIAVLALSGVVVKLTQAQFYPDERLPDRPARDKTPTRYGKSVSRN